MQGRQPGAEVARVFALLELRIPGMTEQAEPVRQQIDEIGGRLVAAGEPHRAVRVDRLEQRQSPLVREQGDHVAGDALGERGPAEHGVDPHRIVAPRGGQPIALDEPDLAALDHADREADHAGPLHQSLEPGVEPGIIDIAGLGRGGALDGHVETGVRVFGGSRRAPGAGDDPDDAANQQRQPGIGKNAPQRHWRALSGAIP